MNRVITRFIFAAVILLAVSCTRKMEIALPDSLKISGISVELKNGSSATKAVEALADSVGRTSFSPRDTMHFTSIRRSGDNPLEKYTYSNVDFAYSNDKAWEKVDKTKDIYWTDANSPHTFIGYSKPNVTDFDWNLESGHFYGTVGKADGTGLLQFVAPPAPATPGDQGSGEQGSQGSDDQGSGDTTRSSGTTAVETTTLAAEDILLTYHDNLTHKDAVAFVDAHHGLSSMRVTVQISGFSTSQTDNDHMAKVTDLVVKNQPVKYVWEQSSYGAAAVIEGQVYRDMQLYLPNPDGKYPGETRNAFVFYGITSPHETDNLNIEFTVEYPDPMGQTTSTGEIKTITSKYVASLGSASKKVLFSAGYCTSIIINLNHKDETITVGASYNDWIYVDTPDYGDLDRIQVFLKDARRSRVTVHSDAIEHPSDDATWLYLRESDGQIVDVYGNDGSETHPYMIRTADEFLSFAYEVNEATDPVRGVAGWDFANKFITLDSGLILQPSNTASSVSWPGIGVKTTPGVDSDTDRPFNGHLMGGVRLIKRLKGKPLFGYIGPLGHVDQLLLEDVLDIDGAAAYVTQNDGIICAGKVASVVGDSFALKNPITVGGLKLDETDNFKEITWNKESDPYYENGETTIAAPFVAYNNGIVLACYCVATVSTPARRSSGIIGYNNGAMVVDYSAVKINGSAFYRGTVAYNRYHPDFFIDHDKPHPDPDNKSYQPVKFDKKAERIFDVAADAAREVTYTVTGLKDGKEPVKYEWGTPRGETVEIVSADKTTASLTVRSKHGARGETFFPVKVYYSETEYVEDYVRAMAAEPLKEPTRLKGDYAGRLTYCFFDYEVSGVDPTLALGQVYGYTTAQMQSRQFIGSPDYSNVDTNTLNGTIHTFASESNAHLIPASIMEGYKVRYFPEGGEAMVSQALKQLSAHCMARYYVFHAASYPWVY